MACLALFAAARQLSDLAFKVFDNDCKPAFCPPEVIFPVVNFLYYRLFLGNANLLPKLANIAVILVIAQRILQIHFLIQTT